MVKEFHVETEGKDAASVILNRFSPEGAMTYDEFCSNVIGLPSGAHVVKDVDPEVERLRPQKLRERISDAIKGRIYRNPAAMKKAFVMFDKDFGGSVSWPEFRDGFRDLGLPASQAQVKELFRDFGPDKAGQLAMKPFSQQLLGIEDKPAERRPNSTVPRSSRGRTPLLAPPSAHAGLLRPRSTNECVLASCDPPRGASRLSIRGGLSSQRGRVEAPNTPSHMLIRTPTPLMGMSQRDVISSHRRGVSSHMIQRHTPPRSTGSNVNRLSVHTPPMSTGSNRLSVHN